MVDFQAMPSGISGGTLQPLLIIPGIQCRICFRVWGYQLWKANPRVFPSAETALSSLKQPHKDRPPVVSSPHQRRDSDRYCQLCAAWFNNPMMAQQHYDGKKHKKNAARADLLEQLGKTLDLGELRGEGKGRAGGCCCLLSLMLLGDGALQFSSII